MNKLSSPFELPRPWIRIGIAAEIPQHRQHARKSVSRHPLLTDFPAESTCIDPCLFIQTGEYSAVRVKVAQTVLRVLIELKSWRVKANLRLVLRILSDLKKFIKFK